MKKSIAQKKTKREKIKKPKEKRGNRKMTNKEIIKTFIGGFASVAGFGSFIFALLLLA